VESSVLSGDCCDSGSWDKIFILLSLESTCVVVGTFCLWVAVWVYSFGTHHFVTSPSQRAARSTADAASATADAEM
jgi:hypothetical protein